MHVPKVFADAGVPIVQGDTSRVVGWSQMRARLIGKEIGGERIPMIFFTDDCLAARDYIPALTRHPSETKKEDAQEHGEATHSCDAIRLACMAHTIIKDRISPMQSRIDDAMRMKPSIKNIINNYESRAIYS